MRQNKKYSDYREFITEEEIAEFQENNYGNYCRRYKETVDAMSKYEYRTREMHEHIERYLGNEFHRINSYMRKHEDILSDKEIEELISRASSIDKDILIKKIKELCLVKTRMGILIDKISELIYCAPEINENIIVYRGVTENVITCILEEADKYNGLFCEEGFMSTSLRLDTVIREFQGYDHILKIYVPKGAHALGVDGIKKRSEEELLFPAEQWLKYVKKKYNKKGKRIYEFELTLTQT